MAKIQGQLQMMAQVQYTIIKIMGKIFQETIMDITIKIWELMAHFKCKMEDMNHINK